MQQFTPRNIVGGRIYPAAGGSGMAGSIEVKQAPHWHYSKSRGTLRQAD